MYALCDVNAMYASCEKVFDPSLRRRPVVVLTNNDGCICAACGIARRLGVGKKFVPFFQVREQLAQAGAVIRSSNYELYADLSQKLMDTCSRFAPHSHVYSIDECFLYYGAGRYTPPDGWQAHAEQIRRTVWREVRLPLSVGLGATPTLAKAASHAAKRLEGFNGVAVIDSEAVRRKILAQMAVADIWGIGRRLSARLQAMGITTALALAESPPALIRKLFSVRVESTVHELNGEVRLSWDEVRAPRKEIYSTRSFGQRITDRTLLRQALASHAEIACAKLRRQGSLARGLIIFAGNSPHDNERYVRRSVFHRFTVPTADTSRVMAACEQAMAQLYQSGVRYYRCGIGLVDLCGEAGYQHDLFTASDDRSALMQCMDSINTRYGRGTVQLAGSGIRREYRMRRAYLSPQYTTRWGDIPRVYCE